MIDMSTEHRFITAFSFSPSTTSSSGTAPSCLPLYRLDRSMSLIIFDVVPHLPTRAPTNSSVFPTRKATQTRTRPLNVPVTKADAHQPPVHGLRRRAALDAAGHERAKAAVVAGEGAAVPAPGFHAPEGR